MAGIAQTPSPPYFAVIFTSQLSKTVEGYAEMAATLVALAEQQPGFLGMESARDTLGITLSYWSSWAAIKNWKEQVDHRAAQLMGKHTWYSSYQVRIAKVERDYQMAPSK